MPNDTPFAGATMSLRFGSKTRTFICNLCDCIEQLPVPEQLSVISGLSADEKAELTLHTIKMPKVPMLRTLLQTDVRKVWDAEFSKKYMTPLGAAVGCRHVEVCRLLLENGENPNGFTGTNHRTPLFSAVNAKTRNQIEVDAVNATVSILITYGAIKSISDDHGTRLTTLSSGFVEALRYGSPGYIPANERTMKYMQELTVEERFDLVLKAMYSEFYDEIEMLLKTGLDPNMVHNKRSFLFHASKRDLPNSAKATELLQEGRCNPNTKMGHRCLIHSLIDGHRETHSQTQELVDLWVKGGFIKSLAPKGKCGAWFRADEQDSEAYVAANDNTRRYMNDLSQADKDQTLLSACKMGYRDEIQMLIECGASIESPALIEAALAHGKDAARILLKAGAKVPNKRDGDSRTTLQELIDESASRA